MPYMIANILPWKSLIFCSPQVTNINSLLTAFTLITHHSLYPSHYFQFLYSHQMEPLYKKLIFSPFFSQDKELFSTHLHRFISKNP